MNKMPNRLREIRETKGWNQRELAEATHVCQTVISDLEREVRKPWPLVVKRLSKALKQTKWAPFWVIPKAFGKNRRVHPGRLTKVKRSWRRGKIKV